MEPKKLFKDLTWADLIIPEDELICSTLRNHYIIQHTKCRLLLLTNEDMV